MKKRVLMIIPDRILEPTGGMGVVFKHTQEKLKESFDFDIVGFPEEGHGENYHGAQNPFPNIRHGAVLSLAAQVAYIDQGLAFERPDIVHAYDWSVYTAGVTLAKHFDVPLVVTMQLSIQLLIKNGISYVWNAETLDGQAIHNALIAMELYGLEEADAIVQVSEAYAGYFSTVPGLSQKTTVVPNGIDLDQWTSKVQKVLPGEGAIKVLYIGRFAEMKGVEALLQARVPDSIDLIFVGESEGDKNLFTLLQQKVEQSSNIHFLGPLYGEEKIATFAAVDAVVMPSLHEPFGIVALEALASKSILLSSMKDGLSDFLTSDIALDCGTTPYSITKAFEELVALTKEEKEGRIVKGLEVCKEYSWESSTQKMRDVYEKLL